MNRWREIALIGVLFAALIAFTVYGPARSSSGEDKRGSTYSKGDVGALGLQLWLETLGYTTERFEYTDWSLPDDAAVLFIIAPRDRPIVETEADEILRWVRDGGTLIAVDERPQLKLAANALWRVPGCDDDGERHRRLYGINERATPVQPVLFDPPVTSVEVASYAVLQPQDAGYVPILESRYGPIMIARQEGRGYIYLSAAAHPFTNIGLREPGSAALVLNLISRVPAARRSCSMKCIMAMVAPRA